MLANWKRSLDPMRAAILIVWLQLLSLVGASFDSTQLQHHLTIIRLRACVSVESAGAPITAETRALPVKEHQCSLNKCPSMGQMIRHEIGDWTPIANEQNQSLLRFAFEIPSSRLTETRHIEPQTRFTPSEPALWVELHIWISNYTHNLVIYVTRWNILALNANQAEQNSDMK